MRTFLRRNLLGLGIGILLVVISVVGIAIAFDEQSEPARPAVPAVEDLGGPSTNRPDLNLDNSEVAAYGTLQMRLYIDLSTADIATIKEAAPDFFNKIGLLGWERDGNRLYKMAPAVDLDIHLGEEIVRVKNGKFAFLAESGSGAEIRNRLKTYLEQNADPGQARISYKASNTDPLPFSLSIKGKPIPRSYIEVAKFDLGLDESSAPRLDIVENINFWTMRSPMCCSVKPKGQGKANEPMDTRCMDYNGPLSKDYNPPKYDPRAYLYFLCSDCDIAWGLKCPNCWNDHLVGGCLKNHGKLCSVRIGHSTSYHKHSWSQCKASCVK